jgi:hypothetical protein
MTNKGEDYENIYGMFFEVLEGRSTPQMGLLDFVVAAEKYAPRHRGHESTGVAPLAAEWSPSAAKPGG